MIANLFASLIELTLKNTLAGICVVNTRACMCAGDTLTFKFRQHQFFNEIPRLHSTHILGWLSKMRTIEIVRICVSLWGKGIASR
jgi:hypothetical protein